MKTLSNLRRLRAGTSAGSSTLVHLALLTLVGVASLIALAATLTLHRLTKTDTLHVPSWPESNALVAHANGSSDTRASLTVHFRRGTTAAEQHRLLAHFGAVETGSISQLGLDVVKVDTSKAVALLSALRSSHVVSNATPNDVRQITGDVSSSTVAGQWAFKTIESTIAQRSTTAKRDETIAVLDTGVDSGVSGMSRRLVEGWSAFAGSTPTTDPNGHGTWMASIALAADPSAHVMPVQVLNAKGLGDDSDIIEGLVWAADHHANVIAMSFAGTGYSPELERAIDYAWSKGAVVIAATGNAGSSEPTYPAGDAKVVGVSATDANDRLWSGSNFGADTFLAAPGVDVIAANRGGGTTTITGTSASAALTAGSAALLLGADLKATNATVVGRLAAGADKIGTRFTTGHGRLDVARSARAKNARAITPPGVPGHTRTRSFVGPYVAAGSSTAPTIVAQTTCPQAAGACTASSNQLVVTLTAPVPANSTLFVLTGRAANNTTAVTATDNSTGGPNTWTQDANINNATAPQQTVSLLRTFVTHPLVTGNTVTITYPLASTLLKAATIFYVNGLLSTGVVDSTVGTATGATSPASAATGATTGGNDLVLGLVGNSTVGTANNGCSVIGTTPGVAGTMQPAALYKTVLTTGAMTCGITTAAGSWSAITGAYKVDVANPAAAVTYPTTSVNTATYTGAITGSGTDTAGGSGIDTTAGKTQLSIHDNTTNQYWSGSAWSGVGGAETYFDPTTAPTVATPGTAATWSYSFGGTNMTVGDSYTVHTTTTDLAGNASSVATQTFSYLAAPTAENVVGTTVCANTGTVCSATSNTLVVTLTAPVPVNATLFITAGWNASSATGITATDNSTGGPNTYTRDAQINNATAPAKTAALLRAPVTHALATGNTITITFPASSTALKSAVVADVTGLLTTSPLDSTAGTATGATSPASATTGATTFGNDVVVGSDVNATLGAANNGCTAFGAAGVAGQMQVSPVGKVVNTTGAQVCGMAVAASSWAAVTAAYKIDGTAPTAALTFPTAASYNTAGWTGTITGTATDTAGGSGIDTAAGKTTLEIQNTTTGQYWTGSAWGAATALNPTTGPTAVVSGTAAPWSYTFASSNLTDGDSYTITTTTTDLAGNVSSVASATTEYDISAPTAATLTTNASYNAAGWPGHIAGTTNDATTGATGIASVNVSIADSVSGKCWNATNFTTAPCPNWVPVTSGGTATGAADATWQYTLATAALTDGHTYTVSVQAKDGTTSGNTSGTLTAGTFKYDTTAPAFGTLAYVLSGNCNSQLFASGATIFYRPTAGVCANAFDVSAPVTDATSGPASVAFPAIATGSFAHTAETDSTGPSPFVSALHYGWSATSASFSSTSTLTATDNAGNTATTNLTITLDATAPTGGSISVPAYATTASVTVTSTNYTDGGSGIASNVLTRSNGQAPVGGVCPASGYTGTNAVSSPDTTVVDGQCYVYTLTGTDNVGNTAAVSSSPVQVDTTKPTDAITLNSASGAFKSGATVYYKGSAAGSFKIQDAVSDGGSGPKSATFGTLTGGTGFSTHTSETINTPAAGPFVSSAISWTSATGAPTIPVNGTDAAGNNSLGTTLTLALDNTAPVTGSISVPAYVTSTSVTITSTNYTDAGSGIASNAITRSNGQAPTAGVCPASGYTGSTVETSPDTTVVNGQCYVYTLTGTDNVGNVATVATSPVLVDTTAPADALTLNSASGAFKSGTTVYYRGTAAGSFKVQDAVTDGISGPASATFGALSGAGFTTHSLETISTPAGGPYLSTAIAWTSSSASPTIAVHGTDAAGNSQSDTTLTLTNDSTGPTGGSISVPGYATALSVTITSTNYSADAGSGLASNALTRSNAQAPVAGVCPASGYTGANAVSSPDTTVANGQCYVYTLTGTDNVGNTSTVASSPVLVDTTAPTDAITLNTPSGAFKSGTTVYYKGNAAGSFKLQNAVTDSASGPASATFGALSGTGFTTHSLETISTPAGGPYLSTAIAWTSSTASPTIAVSSHDGAGNVSTGTTLTLTNDTTGPTGGSISVPSYATAVSVAITSSNYNADAGAGVATNAITRSNGQAPTAGVCPATGYTGTNAVTSPDTTSRTASATSTR